MKLIMLGAPGAGKGTQAEILSKKLGIPTISTGNILRAAVKAGTPIGLKAKSFMDAGALVPDDVIIGIIAEALQGPECANGYILDGVPRTIPQAEAMEQQGVAIDWALDIEVDDDMPAREIHKLTREIAVEAYQQYGVVLTVGYEMKNAAGEVVCAAESEHVFLTREGKFLRMKRDMPEFTAALEALRDEGKGQA